MTADPQFDGDSPEWTEADFAEARPASEVLGSKTAAALVRPAKQGVGTRSGIADQSVLARGLRLAA